MIETEKKYGIKLSIIGSADYEDYKDVCDAILSRGFKAVVVDNGNMVFERVNQWMEDHEIAADFINKTNEFNKMLERNIIIAQCKICGKPFKQYTFMQEWCFACESMLPNF